MATAGYLLDANIVPDLIRNPQGSVRGAYRGCWSRSRMHECDRRLRDPVRRAQARIATANVAEFRRVPKLAVVNWLVRT